MKDIGNKKQHKDLLHLINRPNSYRGNSVIKNLAIGFGITLGVVAFIGVIVIGVKPQSNTCSVYVKDVVEAFAVFGGKDAEPLIRYQREIKKKKKKAKEKSEALARASAQIQEEIYYRTLFGLKPASEGMLDLAKRSAEISNEYKKFDKEGQKILKRIQELSEKSEMEYRNKVLPFILYVMGKKNFDICIPAEYVILQKVNVNITKDVIRVIKHTYFKKKKQERKKKND